MTSATVRIWRDCGFTEGTLEVPSKTSSLPSYQYSFTLPAVPREDLFNSFRIKHAYEDLYDCNYLQVTYDMNNGDDVTVYGWIDAVRCISDTAGSPNTLIEWHTDLWRTFLSKATFGAGVVTKRPQSGTVPPQTYSNMTQLAIGPTTAILPTTAGTYWWAIMNITVTDSSTGITYFQTRAWPVNPNYPSNRLTISYGSTTAEAPSYYETVQGSFDETIGIDPESIYAAWLSPIAPAGWASSAGVVSMANWRVATRTVSSTTYGTFYPNPSISESKYYSEWVQSLSAKTTDTETYVVCDMDNTPVFQLPWGVTVTSASSRIVNADVSAYISIRFTTSDMDTDESGASGLTCNIPLKSLGVSSNARSSYIYSGQQEYDRESMSIARDQALVSGLTSAMTGSTNNAVMASLGNSRTDQSGQYMLNSKGKPIPTGSGAVSSMTKAGMSIPAAAAVTMGTGIAGAAIDYFATGYFNDRTMDATMDYKAKQTSALTLPSSGADFVAYGNVPLIRMLQWDEYSMTQRASDIALYGISVREPMTSCQALINQGGPIRIQNLNVTGSIPPGAKHFFRERFAQGVRMI